MPSPLGEFGMGTEAARASEAKEMARMNVNVIFRMEYLLFMNLQNGDRNYSPDLHTA